MLLLSVFYQRSDKIATKLHVGWLFILIPNCNYVKHFSSLVRIYIQSRLLQVTTSAALVNGHYTVRLWVYVSDHERLRIRRGIKLLDIPLEIVQYCSQLVWTLLFIPFLVFCVLGSWFNSPHLP